MESCPNPTKYNYLLNHWENYAFKQSTLIYSRDFSASNTDESAIKSKLINTKQYLTKFIQLLLSDRTATFDVLTRTSLPIFNINSYYIIKSYFYSF